MIAKFTDTDTGENYWVAKRCFCKSEFDKTTMGYAGGPSRREMYPNGKDLYRAAGPWHPFTRLTLTILGRV
jgi:hypothetical protein